MNSDVVKNLIQQSNGEFFTVVFKKLDGTFRKINCRIGVRKYLKDEFKLHEPFVTGISDLGHNFDRVTVYDIKNKGYRSFYLSAVKSIKIRGFSINNTLVGGPD